MQSRRSFLQKTALATTALGLFPAGQYAFNTPRQDGPLRVGLIGVGLRGTNHLGNLLLRDDVTITALCDTDPSRLELCRQHIGEAGKPGVVTFGEHPYSYRDLLALENVDAVVISTPWQWHAAMAVCAMNQGKHTVHPFRSYWKLFMFEFRIQRSFR